MYIEVISSSKINLISKRIMSGLLYRIARVQGRSVRVIVNNNNNNSKNYKLVSTSVTATATTCSSISNTGSTSSDTAANVSQLSSKARNSTSTTTTTESASSSSSGSSSADSNSSNKTTSLSSSLTSKNNHNSNNSRFGLSIIGSLVIGYGIGRLQNDYNGNSNQQYYKQNPVLTNGLPRTCCDKEHDHDHDNNNLNNESTIKTNAKTNPNTNQQIQQIPELTTEQKELPDKLEWIVGKENIIHDASVNTTKTLPYLKGTRIGHGNALCIVSPTKLQHVVDIVQHCIRCNCTILVQGQNTSLTGGSVPRSNTNTSANTTNNNKPEQYRPTVIISMKLLNSIFPIDDGKRVVCMGGVGLIDLENFLNNNFTNRESHCQLGSTFLNPTVGGGLAYGSGGTHCCRKGPAYTERAVYLQILTNKYQEHNIHIYTTLNVNGINERNYIQFDRERCTDDSILVKGTISNVIKTLDSWFLLIKKNYTDTMKYTNTKHILHGTKQSHDTTYVQRLCTYANKENNDNDNNTTDTTQNKNKKNTKGTTSTSNDEDTIDDSKVVSRYNADVTGPDFIRSEGKVIVLASVHDTFIKPKRTKTLWIGFDTIETAYEFRSTVCLQNPTDVPILLEYMNYDTFDIINTSGRLLGNIIKYTGTSSTFVQYLWNIKLYIESLPFTSAPYIVDQFLYTINNYLPPIVPEEIMNIGTQYKHNVAITIGDFSNDDNDNNNNNYRRHPSDNSLDRFMERLHKFQEKYNNDETKIKVYACPIIDTTIDVNTINDKNKNNDKKVVDSISALRFAAAPAFRTWCIGQQKQGISIDYALPIKTGTSIPNIATRTTTTSTKTETETEQQQEQIIVVDEPVKRMRYSHFGCNVIHEDIAYNSSTVQNIHTIKHSIKDIIEEQYYGKLPAEHGHGTEYIAPKITQDKWKRIDPLNYFNPGIGGLSRNFRYED